jgi:hypothetical protein
VPVECCSEEEGSKGCFVSQGVKGASGLQLEYTCVTTTDRHIHPLR